VTEIREFYQNQTVTINTKKWQSFSRHSEGPDGFGHRDSRTMNTRLYAQVERDMQRMMDDHGASSLRLVELSGESETYVDDLENQNFGPRASTQGSRIKCNQSITV
jgi:hypothetical protein